MLSRTADNLYWLSRYIERTENIARLIDAALRVSSLSVEAEGSGSEWHSTIVAAGCEEGFYAKYEQATAPAVVHYLIREPSNPSSIMTCLETARQNSRAVRTALTVDMWEAVNSTWMEARAFTESDFSPERIRRFLDWIKERSLLFGGAAGGTMMRNDAFWFNRLGAFIERADNTARILDVKYNVLLPRHESVGGTMDYHQWTSILRSVSALRAYHWVYRDRVKPWLVAELLILRPEMPRSLVTCLREIVHYLDLMATAYGNRGNCHTIASSLYGQVADTTIEEVFKAGLHEFLTDFIDRNVTLGDAITRQYLS